MELERQNLQSQSEQTEDQNLRQDDANPEFSASAKLYRSLPLLLGILVVVVLGTLVFDLSLVAPNASGAVPEELQSVRDADTATLADASVFYPDEVFETDWSRKIRESDILHQAVLHRGCLKHRNSVISWEFGRTEQDEAQDLVHLANETDPQLLEKLKQCPVIDVFLPEDIRSFGYCEDATAYTMFLKSRMLPRWVMEHKFQDESRNRSVTYHELCPNTPMIFFNHYWDGLPNASDWPAAKPMYLMPNVEMYELRSEHYWRADVILCKTALCAKYVSLWFKQEGNPKGARVLYTRHTTSNLAVTFKSQLTASEAKARPEKNFSNVSILHTAGNSVQKGTRQVLDCWLSRPDLPPLQLYMSPELYNKRFFATYAKRIDKSTNVLLHTGQLEPAAFGRLIADATYFMCSSVQEGYGHYIDQARSSRAFIFATDVSPMNELITPRSGALIKATAVAYSRQFLSGKSTAAHALRGVPGFVASFTSREVCDAVVDVLKNTTPEEREKRADKALQQYYFDTVFFAQKMQELREFARAQSNFAWRADPAR